MSDSFWPHELQQIVKTVGQQRGETVIRCSGAEKKSLHIVDLIDTLQFLSIQPTLFDH